MIKIERHEVPAQLFGLETVTGFVWLYKGINTKTGTSYKVCCKRYPKKITDKVIRDCIKQQLTLTEQKDK